MEALHIDLSKVSQEDKDFWNHMCGLALVALVGFLSKAKTCKKSIEKTETP